MGIITISHGSHSEKFDINHVDKKITLNSYLKERLRGSSEDNLNVVKKFLNFIENLIDISDKWDSNIDIYINRLNKYNLYGWESARANFSFLVFIDNKQVFTNAITNLPYNCGVGVMQRFDYFYKLEYYGKDKYELILDAYVKLLNNIYTSGYYKAFIITLQESELVHDLIKRGFNVGLTYHNIYGRKFYILNKTFNNNYLNEKYTKLEERIYSSIENKKPNSKTVETVIAEESSTSSSEDWLDNSF